MTANQVKRLFEAREDVHKAQRRLNAVLNDVARIGTDVIYEKRHGLVVKGRVVAHSTWGEKVHVQNLETGRDYWVTAYEILKAEGPDYAFLR